MTLEDLISQLPPMYIYLSTVSYQYPYLFTFFQLDEKSTCDRKRIEKLTTIRQRSSCRKREQLFQRHDQSSRQKQRTIHIRNFISFENLSSAGKKKTRSRIAFVTLHMNSDKSVHVSTRGYHAYTCFSMYSWIQERKRATCCNVIFTNSSS